MNFRTNRVGLLCLLLTACSGANFEEVIVQETPDASQLGSVAPPDAEVVGDGRAKEDAAEGSVDAGTEDAVCSVSWIPEGWTSSDNCGANVGTSSACPPCLPYQYQCSGGNSYPSTLTGVISGLTGNLCSSAPACVRSSFFDNACASVGSKTQAYSCTELTDGAIVPDPLPGCVDSGFPLG